MGTWTCINLRLRHVWHVWHGMRGTRLLGQVELAADAIRRVEQRHVVTAPRRHRRAREALRNREGAHHCEAA